MRASSLMWRVTIAGVAVVALLLIGLDAFVYLNLRARLTRFANDVLFTRVQLVERVMQGQTPEALAVRLMELGIPAIVQLPDGSERRVEPLTPRFGESPPGPLSTIPAPMLSQTLPLAGGGQVIVFATRAGVDNTLRRLLVLEAIGTGAGIALATILFRRAARIALAPIDHIVATAREIAAGQTGERLRPANRDTEIGRMAAAFDDMLEALETALKEAQEAAVSERTLRRRLEMHARYMVSAQESERRRVAGELHDEIGQSLTGLKLTLDKMESASDLPSYLGRAQNLTNELLQRVHDLSLELRPQMLDDLGLLPSLIWLFERYTSLTGIDINFDHEGMEQRLPSDIETAAFRIVQEALTNVARHAQVDEAFVVCRLIPDDLFLCVEDYGVGFERQTDVGSLSTGLALMEERARAVGGTLSIASVPGEGTRVTATLPTTRSPVGAAERQERERGGA